MGVKTGSKIPLLLAAVALGAGGLYAVSTATKPNEDERKVVFTATWEPDKKARLVLFGIKGRMEERTNVSSTFTETRTYPKGSIATLSLVMPLQEGGYTGGCRIQVDNQAGKLNRFWNGECEITKYVG